MPGLTSELEQPRLKLLGIYTEALERLKELLPLGATKVDILLALEYLEINHLDLGLCPLSLKLGLTPGYSRALVKYGSPKAFYRESAGYWLGPCTKMLQPAYLREETLREEIIHCIKLRADFLNNLK